MRKANQVAPLVYEEMTVPQNFGNTISPYQPRSMHVSRRTSGRGYKYLPFARLCYPLQSSRPVSQQLFQDQFSDFGYYRSIIFAPIVKRLRTPFVLWVNP